ncbi:MAG: carbon-nitrogen hydrolase family protein [Xanthobacteraceae bacterium]|nr:carbon-nitrogen hydrolase family protein [Xanthobacteraceae bacterium]
MVESKKRPVRVGLIQQAGLTDDLEANKRALLAQIEALAPKADYVMPTELSYMPYFGRLRDESLRAWAEKINGEFLSQVGAVASREKTTILAPVYLATHDGSAVNAVVVFGPDGKPVSGHAKGQTTSEFRKVHLPYFWRNGKGLDETFYFQRGDVFPVFDTPKAKIGILICYDRRFPEAWRSLALEGAEIVFMPSCIPAWNPSALASTSDMFAAELRTRACENGNFVVACNRAGTERFRDLETPFIGASCVIDPAGGVVCQLSPESAESKIIEIDLYEMARVRRRLTLLEDRQISAYDIERESTQSVTPEAS